VFIRNSKRGIMKGFTLSRNAGWAAKHQQDFSKPCGI
jgi:hypothetical protein